MIYQDLLDTVNEDVVAVDNSYIEAEIKSGRKRMRLHQLSWEEKIQRKKLRNRIAAQTSRDRKKARMDHLEESVKQLREKNVELSSQILELQKQNESLLSTNAELQKALSMRSCTCTCLSKSTSDEADNISKKTENHFNSDSNSVGVDHLLEVPAESSNDPRQKGRKTLTQDLMLKTSWTLWKIFTLYLLTQKCWEISKTTHSLMTWKNWQQVCFEKLSNMNEEEQLQLWKNRYFLKTDQGKCWSPDEMVGKASEKLESCRSDVLNLSSTNSQTLNSVQWSTQDMLINIALDHSYAQPTSIFQFLEEYIKFKPGESSQLLTCPKIEITDVDTFQDVEMTDSLKAVEESNNFSQHLFPNFHSPKSEISSDQGYESPCSPTYSEFSGSDGLNEIFTNNFSELFPELL
ncbi:UNVERIFIED_CONTAM: hypothetical protein PYX00_005512 [Menopon gallinae]|uniref:X-box-binding protein 1 n=1 Tax=Menopon gallinae TaxID=328185 RepID=A0AAW2HSM0_9NEOP